MTGIQQDEDGRTKIQGRHRQETVNSIKNENHVYILCVVHITANMHKKTTTQLVAKDGHCWLRKDFGRERTAERMVSVTSGGGAHL